MQNVYFRLTHVAHRSETLLLKLPSQSVQAVMYDFLRSWKYFQRKRFFLNSLASLSKQEHICFPSNLHISFQQYFRLFLVCRIKNYSDYLQGLYKEDRLYEYYNPKNPMKKILSDLYQNCRLRIENLKVIKHR